MPYAHLGETTVDPGLVYVDPMDGFNDGGFDITPTVVITPGQGGGGGGGGNTLPAPVFTPESPQGAPQILPDLVSHATAPGAAGVPWGLLLALLGGYAVLSGKGRGTRGF